MTISHPIKKHSIQNETLQQDIPHNNHVSKSGRYRFVGMLITLMGAIFFSGKAILVKMAYRDTHIDSISLLALRMIFSLPFFLALAWFSGRRDAAVTLSRKEWAQIAIVGLMGYYVSSLLDFIGLRYISAGLERLILFTYPTMVLLLGAIIHKNKIGGAQLIALLLSYVGIAIAFASDVSKGGNSNVVLGSVLVLTCAFTYAIYVFSSGQLIPKVGTMRFTSLAMLAATAGILLHYLIGHQFRFHLFRYEFNVYLYSFIMAVFTTVLPSLFVSEGIKRIGSGNVAIISTIGPLATIAQAYWLLHEPFGWQQAIGTVLVMLGVFFLGSRIKGSE